MGTGASVDRLRRRELAGFLRSRRERIGPRERGLPVHGHRRTPGLRREEVADLAGVGVGWYTWLEQGRTITPSEHVLGSLAHALGLTDFEHDHLLRLARPDAEARARPARPDGDLPVSVSRILAKLEPYPAVAHDATTEILAANTGYAWLMGLEPRDDDRNALRLSLTDPHWQTRMPDWHDRLPVAVAELRARSIEHLDDPAWLELLEDLSSTSVDFRRLWERHEVAPMVGTTKRIRHPEAGMLHFEFTHLWSTPDLRVTTYTPLDDATTRALTRCVPRRPSSSCNRSAASTVWEA